jgi:outer membrane protein, heavy metal efflux system
MNRAILLFVMACIPICLYGQSINRTLSLRDAISYAMGHNPEIQSAEAGAKAARGRYWSGISLPPPELSVVHEYIPQGGSLGNYSERSVGIAQSFEFPTNYFVKASLFSREEEFAYANALLKQRQIIARVTNAYFEVVCDRMRLHYAMETQALSRTLAEKEEVRSTLGETPPLARLLAKVQFSESKNNVANAQNELVRAYAYLSHAMGLARVDHDTTMILTDSLTVTPWTRGFDSLAAIVEGTNPRILAACSRLGSASSTRSLGWSSLLPSFSIAYFSQSRDGVGGYYGASIGISLPIWFMFDTRGKVQEAQAGICLAEAELAATRSAVMAELYSAATDLRNNENSVRLYERDLLPQAEEVFRTAFRSYSAGDLSYIEYIQARMTLVGIRNNYVNSLSLYRQSLSAVEELVGDQDAEYRRMEQ